MPTDETREFWGQTALEGRALRECWPIPDEARAKILERMINIILSDQSNDRNRISAARVIGTFSGLNLDQQRIDLLSKATSADQAAVIISESLRLASGPRPGGLPGPEQG